MDEATRFLLGQGILGVVVAALAWWILHKDREHVTELSAVRTACDAEKKALLDAFVTEKDGRIRDAQSYAGMSLQLQRDVLTYVSGAKEQDVRIVDNVGVLAIKISECTKAIEELERRQG